MNNYCKYLETIETDYDTISGHSSYKSYCNLTKQDVPYCGWRKDNDMELKCKYLKPLDNSK